MLQFSDDTSGEIRCGGHVYVDKAKAACFDIAIHIAEHTACVLICLYVEVSVIYLHDLVGFCQVQVIVAF